MTSSCVGAADCGFKLSLRRASAAIFWSPSGPFYAPPPNNQSAGSQEFATRPAQTKKRYKSASKLCSLVSCSLSWKGVAWVEGWMEKNVKVIQQADDRAPMMPGEFGKSPPRCSWESVRWIGNISIFQTGFRFKNQVCLCPCFSLFLAGLLPGDLKFASLGLHARCALITVDCAVWPARAEFMSERLTVWQNIVQNARSACFIQLRVSEAQTSVTAYLKHKRLVEDFLVKCQLGVRSTETRWPIQRRYTIGPLPANQSVRHGCQPAPKIFDQRGRLPSRSSRFRPCHGLAAWRSLCGSGPAPKTCFASSAELLSPGHWQARPPIFQRARSASAKRTCVTS